MSDVLVIRCKRAIRHEELEALRRNILAQKETGVIVLPSIFLDAVVVPDDIKIIVANDIEEGGNTMKLIDFLSIAYNDVAVENSRLETELYIKYSIDPAKYLNADILNREIKAIKAEERVFRVRLEEENND